MSELFIKKIHLRNLNEFIHSEEFKELNDSPISIKRVNSYLRNPNSNIKNSVLCLGFINKQLVVYRSVFQDQIIYKNQNVEIAWLSGVWTHIKYRRRGFANLLLENIYKDYNGMLFVSNLATNSSKLIKQNKYFAHLHSLNGHRFYYRFSFSEILPPKSTFFKNIKTFLSISDKLGNTILDLKILFSTKSRINNISPAIYDSELEEFISKHNQNSLFQRNIEEFSWILQHPWVEQKKQDDELDNKYQFTTSAERFYQKAFMLKAHDEIQGFIFYNVKNEEMRVHYVFYNSENELEEFSNLILNEVRKEKIGYLTIADEKLIKIMKKKGGFLFSKIWTKDFFVGNKLLENYPEVLKKDIYMGDGDSIFT